MLPSAPAAIRDGSLSAVMPPENSVIVIAEALAAAQQRAPRRPRRARPRAGATSVRRERRCGGARRRIDRWSSRPISADQARRTASDRTNGRLARKRARSAATTVLAGGVGSARRGRASRRGHPALDLPPAGARRARRRAALPRRRARAPAARRRAPGDRPRRADRRSGACCSAPGRSDRDDAEAAIARMRFALAVDDDLREFYERYRDDPLDRGVACAARRGCGSRAGRSPSRRSRGRSASSSSTRRARRRSSGGSSTRLGPRCADSGLRDVPSAAALAGCAPARLESFDLVGAARDRARARRARGRRRAHRPRRPRPRARVAAAAGRPDDRALDGRDARRARPGALRHAPRRRPRTTSSCWAAGAAAAIRRRAPRRPRCARCSSASARGAGSPRSTRCARRRPRSPRRREPPEDQCAA